MNHPTGILFRATGILFREIQTLEGLQVGPEEKVWLERPQADPGPRPTVLYLGCNILRTPHLAQTVVALFRSLGENFIALAGPAFCCGVPYEREAGIERARRQGETLASHLKAYQAQQVVMWCPSCFHFYKHVLSVSGPFQLLHVTEFLAEKRGRFRFIPQPTTRVALHYHTGSPDAERQAAGARALLAAIPGVEVLEMGTSAEWGRNCSGMLRERMGHQAWEALITPFFERAAALKADVFATLYHGCHRMYAGHEKSLPFSIEHYLSVVARALGIAYPDKYKEYLLWKNRDRILQDGAPRLKANQVDTQFAATVVADVFVDDRGL